MDQSSCSSKSIPPFFIAKVVGLVHICRLLHAVYRVDQTKIMIDTMIDCNRIQSRIRMRTAAVPYIEDGLNWLKAVCTFIGHCVELRKSCIRNWGNVCIYISCSRPQVVDLAVIFLRFSRLNTPQALRLTTYRCDDFIYGVIKRPRIEAGAVDWAVNAGCRLAVAAPGHPSVVPAGRRIPPHSRYSRAQTYYYVISTSNCWLHLRMRETKN